jgi:hypothetical protein
LDVDTGELGDQRLVVGGAVAEVRNHGDGAVQRVARKSCRRTEPRLVLQETRDAEQYGRLLVVGLERLRLGAVVAARVEQDRRGLRFSAALLAGNRPSACR